MMPYTWRWKESGFNFTDVKLAAMWRLGWGRGHLFAEMGR